MAIDYIWRTRSRGEINLVTGRAYQAIYCNGTYLQNLTGLSQGFYAGETQTVRDCVHPNYARRKANGDIMNTPIHSVKRKLSGFNASDYVITYSNPNLTCTGTNFIKTMAGQKDRRSMNLTPGFGLSFDWVKELESRQTEVITGTKAWGGIKSPAIQGTVFAAELGKTLAMMRSPLVNLRQFLRKVKRGGAYYKWSLDRAIAKKSYNLAEFLSAEWLRYRYGIMPVMYDIEGIKELINEPMVSPRMTSRASERFSSGQLTGALPYSEGSTSFFSGSSTFGLQTDVQVSSGILYEHECLAHDRYGYGLDQQLSAIWEVVPYSFIIDWFVNLGDYIDAISPKVGVKILAQWTTVKSTETKSAVAYATGTPPSQYYSVTGNLNAAATDVTETYIRQPIAKTGVVNLTKSWDVGRVREQKRILDSISLIIGLLKSR